MNDFADKNQTLFPYSAEKEELFRERWSFYRDAHFSQILTHPKKSGVLLDDFFYCTKQVVPLVSRAYFEGLLRVNSTQRDLSKSFFAWMRREWSRTLATLRPEKVRKSNKKIRNGMEVPEYFGKGKFDREEIFEECNRQLCGDCHMLWSVPKNAKDAFKRQLLTNHPDKGGDTEVTKRINRCREYIPDPVSSQGQV